MGLNRRICMDLSCRVCIGLLCKLRMGLDLWSMYGERAEGRTRLQNMHWPILQPESQFASLKLGLQIELVN